MAQGELQGRVLLKLSGEALGGESGSGIDAGELKRIACEVAEAAQSGVQVAVVVGGGNFVRGAELSRSGIQRSTADHIGMLGTVMNGLALAAALESEGRHARTLCAFSAGTFVEPFARDRCERHLQEGRVVVLVGGTGHPYFTTDSCASLRAIEIAAALLLKGTRVDGIYSGDPEVDPSAQLYDQITYKEVLKLGLKVMDATSVAMCMENHMPIRVFNMCKGGNIRRSLLMEEVGTLVSPAG